jgi:hypothetical protein
VFCDHIQKQIEKAPELAARMGAEKVEHFKWYHASLNVPADTQTCFRHAAARKTHDGKFVIIEVCFNLSIEALTMREMCEQVMVHAVGADRMVGPPPPCDKERALRIQINELRQELGKPKVRGRG